MGVWSLGDVIRRRHPFALCIGVSLILGAACQLAPELEN